MKAFGDNSLKAESLYDELGRTTESRKYETGGGYVATLTEYDALGRVKRITNPYRPLQNEPQLWTTSAYDTLGRVTSVTTPDNATAQTTYSGNVVTVTDQAGKQRRSITNALGQLARVDEPDDSGNLGAVSSPAQPTNYLYDTLNNLVTVMQGAQNQNFCLRFVVPRLKQRRLIQNRELISIRYDANGNLTQKTDARGVVNELPLRQSESRCYREAIRTAPEGELTVTTMQQFYSKGRADESQLVKRFRNPV